MLLFPCFLHIAANIQAQCDQNLSHAIWLAVCVQLVSWWALTCWCLCRPRQRFLHPVSPDSGMSVLPQTPDLLSDHSTHTKCHTSITPPLTCYLKHHVIHGLTQVRGSWLPSPLSGSLLLRPRWTFSRRACRVWNQWGWEPEEDESESSWDKQTEIRHTEGTVNINLKAQKIIWNLNTSLRKTSINQYYLKLSSDHPWRLIYTTKHFYCVLDCWLCVRVASVCLRWWLVTLELRSCLQCSPQISCTTVKPAEVLWRCSGWVF